MNHNIAETLPKIAELFPDRKGLICRKKGSYRSWTFSEMNRITDLFAHILTEKGVSRGDRVILMVKPSLEFITLTFALFKIGAVIILIDPGMGFKNLGRCIGQVKPDVFIGIPKAHLFKTLIPTPFRTVRISVCVGFSLSVFGPSLTAETALKYGGDHGPFPAAPMQENDPAAILFTTGSTGPPKGVRYEHGIFQAQLKLIREYYMIGADDIDQPAFPLFALFSTALGACAVIPEMDAAKPARVDPEKFTRTINDNGVTYTFGSPAIWNVVSTYCAENDITLESVRKVLMAGAPVPGELLQRTLAILPDGAEIHTPYGATESLPIVSATAAEILADTWVATRRGMGVFVGRSLPGIEIRIIATTDDPIEKWDDSLVLATSQVGEIVVKGPVVTRAYDNNDRENSLAKIMDEKGFWHRMGDLGYLDEQGRLWFCGRKGHRLETESGSMYTVCCEAIFNEHPDVFRSALVGLGKRGKQVPVIIVELFQDSPARESLFADLRQLAESNPLTSKIDKFLIHPSFPVDIRHNAKIFREKLTVWAADNLPDNS